MKKLINLLITMSLIAALIYVCVNSNELSDRLVDFLDRDPKIYVKEKNDYYKNNDYLFIQNTDDFKPYNYQELLNIFYTVINSGWNTFTFYCPKEYLDCIDDVKKLSTENETLTNINNFVHPYNSFKSIKTSYDQNGEINIHITKLYDKEKVETINNEVNNIINTKIIDTMTNEQKIKTIHDYIINNTMYDVDKNETGESPYDSITAYGTLIDHYAVCGGYSDSMAIFLNKFGIDNYKVSSDSHVWNALYFNDKWIHLDLTWDDPVSKNREQYLLYNYYLITTQELEKLSTVEHYYDKSIYQEIR